MYEPYSVKYCKLMARLATFRRFSDFEYVKTVAAVDALANRAMDLYRGAKQEKYSGIPEIDPDGIFERAESYVDALERGEYPLLGIFAEIGGGIGDHCFIEKDGVMHVFYIRHVIGYGWGERYCDALGHAWSTDLFHWHYEQPALTISADKFDNFQVWAPAVVEKEGKYYMFYTGVNREISQTICLAFSDDLFVWKKYEENPVFVPGNWSPWREDKWSACRDPMVFGDGKGTWYMYYCAQERTDGGTMQDTPADGTHPNNCPIFTDIPVKNVVAVASSTDLIHWKDEGPIRIKGVEDTAESPFVFCHEGTCFLLSAGSGKIFVSDGDMVGGWKPYDNNGISVVQGCSEVFSYKGRWFISSAGWKAMGSLFAQEQYLQIRELFWQKDGSMIAGPYLCAPIDV